DRLKRANLSGRKRAVNSPGEWQVIKRVNPVCGVVEFPIRVTVALLKRVPGAHAQLNWDQVGLLIRELIASAGSMRRQAIRGEDMAGNVVPFSHRFELVGIGLQD